MKLKRTNILSILSIVILSFSMTSCKKNKVGVWEVYRESGIFICCPNDKDAFYGGKEKVYWDNKSCNDLGYTSRGSTEASWFFVSPDGECKPGREGEFWNQYASSGGSGTLCTSSGGNSGTGSSDCSLSNYNGPEFDIQLDAQCKAAYVYDCQNNQQGVDAACANYESFQQQDPTIPDCPYCN
jgi:hypothetical protein